MLALAVDDGTYGTLPLTRWSQTRVEGCDLFEQLSVGCYPHV